MFSLNWGQNFKKKDEIQLINDSWLEWQLGSVTGRSFVYDNAGNVTGDGRHSYQYSPRGRMIAVDHGMTAN